MGWGSAPCLGRLYPRERPGTHCTGGLVGPRAGLDGRKISSPRGSIPFWQIWCLIAEGNIGVKICDMSSNFVGFSSVQFSSVQFSSVQFSSAQLSSVRFSSAQFSSVQFSSAQLSSVQLSSVQFDSVQLSSVQLSSAQLSSVQFSSVQFTFMAIFRFYTPTFLPPLLTSEENLFCDAEISNVKNSSHRTFADRSWCHPGLN